MKAPAKNNKLLNSIVKIINKIPFAHRHLNRFFINKFSYAAPARPRPFSMAAPYTTWRGLTDRRYSGRHLPPAQKEGLPSIEDVLKLFERTEDRRATDTSLLFPFFAQWFTDSFLRTKWKPPGTQDFAENESNHEIDLCQIYGMSEMHTSILREGENGKLKSQLLNDGMYPVNLFEDIDGQVEIKKEFKNLYTPDNFNRVYKNASDEHKRNAFAVGLEHGNSTMGNTLMNILFLREHNRIATELKKKYENWNDERIFQTARNINIVLLLKVVISDYISHIAPVDFQFEAEIGMAERETWYRTNWIAVEFSLLYRWHDLIPDTICFNGDTRDSVELRRNNRWLMNLGIDTVILDSSKQRAGRIGLGNTPDFLLDVKKLSLKMARNCQLQPYNAYRKHYGLEPILDFKKLTNDEKLAKKLKELYKEPDNLEWFVGIFAEAYEKTDMMGELLTTMVGNDAFTQALTNPLLSKAVHNADTFSEEGLKIIKATNHLADIVVRNTNITNVKEVSFKVLESDTRVFGT